MKKWMKPPLVFVTLFLVWWLGKTVINAVSSPPVAVDYCYIDVCSVGQVVHLYGHRPYASDRSYGGYMSVSSALSVAKDLNCRVELR